jgi:hypothetical protein
MTTNRVFQKDPVDEKDFVFDFRPLTNGTPGGTSDFLQAGETISTATVTADPGLTIDSSSNTTSTVTFWTSGGTEDASYTVFCTITTNQSRTIRRSIEVEVRAG